MKKLLAIFAAFWVFFYTDLSLAQVSTPYGGWVDGITSTGQRQWFGPGNQTKSSATVGNAVWTAATTTGAKVTTSAELAFGAAKVPVVLKGIATASAIIGTAKVILGGPVGVGMTAMMLVPALVDYFTTDTTHPGPSSTWGTPTPFEKIDPGSCPAGACYEYQGQLTGLWYSTPGAAAAASVGKIGYWANCTGKSIYDTAVASVTGSGATYSYTAYYAYCDGSYTWPNPGQPKAISSRVGSPTPSQWVPASIDDIRTRMEMEPYVPGVIEGLLNSGGSLPIAYAPGDGWSGVTGPASVPSVPVVKSSVISPAATSASVSTIGGNPYNLVNNSPTVTNTANGTTNIVVDGKSISIPTKLVTTSTYDPATGATTNSTVDATPAHTVSTSTQTKTDLQYGNGTPSGSSTSVPVVTGTTTTTTTTTVTNNVTNNVVNNSTTNENIPLTSTPDPTDLGSITDTAFGAIPALYVRKYPDGLTGVWSAKITAIKATPLFSLVGNLMPTSIGSSGACPTWPIDFNFGAWANFGVHDVAPPCWVWTFGKTVILISALLLARALIFGG